MSRPLGIGLVVLGGVLGGVMFLWLLVTLAAGQTTAGGAVLGLLLAAVLGLPPAGAGLYMISRGRQEADEAAQLGAQRQTLDADRLFRAEQARELEQLARRVDALDGSVAGALAGRLRDLQHDLESPAYDQAAWYEAVTLGSADRAALRRYDDLLSDGLRQMADITGGVENGDAPLSDLQRRLQEWERNLVRRAELLRGRSTPTVAPTDVLAAHSRSGTSEALTRLGPGDAVSRDGVDYLVETSVSYFAGGQTCWLHRLATERDEVWLWVDAGALNLAWLESIHLSVEPEAAEIKDGGASCLLQESRLADAEVRARDGHQSRGGVTVSHYACDDGHTLLVERWMERARTRVYRGQPIKPSDLEVWPAER